LRRVPPTSLLAERTEDADDGCDQHAKYELEEMMTILRYLLVLLLPLVTAAAQAEIYVCTGKAKLTVYQNFPCQFDEIGSLPTSPSKPQVPAPAAAPQLVAASLSGPSEPRNGMTKDEVRAIWGAPTQTASGSDEDGLDGRSETWSYPESREVSFVDDHVLAIRK
jgi:hypothetical protein